MQVSTEPSSTLERQIIVELLPEQLEQAVEEELHRQAKGMRVNGFRPGKVPVSLVKQQEGKAIRRQQRQQLVQEQLRHAIEQQALQPIGGVSVTPDPLEVEAASYQANFEIYPEVILQDVSGIEIEKPRVSVTEQEIEDHIQKMRRVMATWSAVQQPAGPEDRVTVNFTGTIEGEVFEGGKAQNLRLQLWDENLLDGFVEGIIGHQAGEEFSFESTFPSDYADEELRGKTARFSVQLTQVESGTLPELDSETLKTWGIEEGTVEQLQLTVRKVLEDQVKSLSHQSMQRQLKNKLIELYSSLPLPQGLVEKQTADCVFQLEEKGRNVDAASRESVRQQVKRRMTLKLLLKEVAKQREIEVDQERFLRRLQQEGQHYEQPQQLFTQLRKHPEYAQMMRNEILEEQAIDLLLEETSVSERDYTLTEIAQQSKDNL